MDIYDAEPVHQLPGRVDLTPAPAGTRVLAALTSIAIYLSLFIPAVIMVFVAIAQSSWLMWGIVALLVLAAIAGTIVLDVWYVGSRSASVGHRVMGLRLVRFSTGEPIGYQRAAIRWAGRVAADILQVGILLAIVNLIMIFSADNRRHLLDMLADTIVIEDTTK